MIQGQETKLERKHSRKEMRRLSKSGISRLSAAGALERKLARRIVRSVEVGFEFL